MQKTQIIITDDIDGTHADETVTFALDGVDYVIDLTTAHAAELRDVLAPYTRAGRRQSGRKRAAATPRASRGDLEQVRAWARDNGYQVADRGRVKASVLDAYDQRAA